MLSSWKQKELSLEFIRHKRSQKTFAITKNCNVDATAKLLQDLPPL
jgi:hypothetical protein